MYKSDFNRKFIDNPNVNNDTKRRMIAARNRIKGLRHANPNIDVPELARMVRVSEKIVQEILDSFEVINA